MHRGSSNISIDELAQAEKVLDHLMKIYAIDYLIYKEEYTEENVNDNLRESLILAGAKEIIVCHASNIMYQDYETD